MIMTVAMLALFAMLLGLSCAPPPQNNGNAGRSDNATPIKADTDDPELASDACTQPGNKPGNVTEQIRKGILGKAKLKPLYQHRWFKFGIYPGSSPGSLHLYFTGKLADPDSLGELADVVKRVVKKACVEKVFFATDGTLPPSTTAAPLTTDAFFEWWVGCEDPNVPCSGGECRPPDQCPAPAPTPDPVANTNTNTNMNVNTNTNTRPNTNGK